MTVTPYEKAAEDYFNVYEWYAKFRPLSKSAEDDTSCEIDDRTGSVSSTRQDQSASPKFSDSKSRKDTPSIEVGDSDSVKIEIIPNVSPTFRWDCKTKGGVIDNLTDECVFPRGNDPSIRVSEKGTFRFGNQNGFESHSPIELDCRPSRGPRDENRLICQIPDDSYHFTGGN